MGARHQTGAVEARALAVSPAYEAHARELDEQYSRPQVRIQGPDGMWQSVPDASGVTAGARSDAPNR